MLATGDEAPQYRDALERADARSPTRSPRRWATRAQHFRVFDGADTAALDAALWSWPAALPRARRRRRSRWTADKRTTAALAIEHLALHAPVPQREIALPAGAPFGTIAVNRDTCTMCLACVGSCPEGAILDTQEKPQLRFIEAKCVQCGLCETTCPENAIALMPRLNLAPEAQRAAGAERGGDLQVHRVRQAARHREDDRRDARRGSPAIRCSRRPARSTGCRCAPTAA